MREAGGGLTVKKADYRQRAVLCTRRDWPWERRATQST
jgi:hypothetical protein